MLCFNKNNTDSLSVAPVRYPVVQISSMLHIMKRTRNTEKKENLQTSEELMFKQVGEKQQRKKIYEFTDSNTDGLDFRALCQGAGPNCDLTFTQVRNLPTFVSN